MLRKLASVRLIRDIKSIEGADSIELAYVDGWQVVVKKGEFKPEDKIIYCEIDSFLPEKPEYEFLRAGSFKTDAFGISGFRLRTVRLRGALSQGLVLPIPENLSGAALGEEVSEVLGIKKYEAPIPACLRGDVYGPIPGIIRITDQERIQNLLDYFERYKDLEFEESEKLNGTSTTYFFDGDQFGVCGHSWWLKENDSVAYWKVAKHIDIEGRLRKYGKRIAVQGEIIGEGILKKNMYKLRGIHFRIFDIWDIEKQRYLLPMERFVVVKSLGLNVSDHVPILGIRKIFQDYKTVDDLLEHADRMSSLIPVKQEGFVYKSYETVGPEVISFKVINNNFKE
jgi:RNA ligase (TIGR02306 family)